jgi:glycosyltransferase involved in cell wall biosynthesis
MTCGGAAALSDAGRPFSLVYIGAPMPGIRKVSVCLAAYNGAPYVRRQVESILPQLAADDEIIIVDDASRDDTVQVIESIRDERIQLIRHTSNAGIATTFRDAMLRATGDVIFLSDQDDLWLDGKVQAVLARIEAGSHLVVHDAVVVRDGKVVDASRLEARHGGPGFLRNLMRNSYSGCCMAFRRSLLSAVLPLPRSPRIFHDIWIGMNAELSGHNVEFLRLPLIEHTRHDTNASAFHRRKWSTAIADRLALIAALTSFLLRRALRRRDLENRT